MWGRATQAGSERSEGPPASVTQHGGPSHRGRSSFNIKTSGTFKLNTRQGLGLSASFHDSESWKYTIDWLFTTKGTASGTISVAGYDRHLGECRSGVMRFTRNDIGG